MSFTLLWGSILNSSIWVTESKETRLVWITLLAMKDRSGVVISSLVGLSDRAKVTPEECRAAIARLESPDPEDSSGVMEGRRIVRIDGGWRVVNHERYRMSAEARTEYWRAAKRRQREKVKELGNAADLARGHRENARKLRESADRHEDHAEKLEGEEPSAGEVFEG